MVATKATSKEKINDISCNAFKAIAKNYMLTLKEKDENDKLGTPQDDIFKELKDVIDNKTFMTSITSVVSIPSYSGKNASFTYDFSTLGVKIGTNKVEEFYSNDTGDNVTAVLLMQEIKSNAEKSVFFSANMNTSTNTIDVGKSKVTQYPFKKKGLTQIDTTVSTLSTLQQSLINGLKAEPIYKAYTDATATAGTVLLPEEDTAEVITKKLQEQQEEKNRIAEAETLAKERQRELEVEEKERQRLLELEEKKVANAADATAKLQAEQDLKALQVAQEVAEAAARAEANKQQEIREGNALKEKENAAAIAELQKKQQAIDDTVDDTKDITATGSNPLVKFGDFRRENEARIMEFYINTKVTEAEFNDFKKKLAEFNQNILSNTKFTTAIGDKSVITFKNPKFLNAKGDKYEIKPVPKIEKMYETQKDWIGTKPATTNLNASALMTLFGVEADTRKRAK